MGWFHKKGSRELWRDREEVIDRSGQGEEDYGISDCPGRPLSASRMYSSSLRISEIKCELGSFRERDTCSKWVEDM